MSRPVRTPARKPRRTRAPLLLAPVLLVLALLAGCTGGGVQSTSGGDTAAGGGSEGGGSGGGASDGGGSSGGEAAPDGGGAAAPGAVPAVLGQAVPAGRSVVRTASVRVRVDDIGSAAERAAGFARGAGGVLAAEQRSSEGRATLRLQVPPARLDATLAQVAELGTELDREVSSEDVTEQVVDLDSRLATQRASVARVRALLSRATGLGDVVKVEGELVRREADLESLQARLRALTGQVEMATLVVELEAAGTTTAGLGFADGLQAGWAALVTGLRGAAVVLGAAVPFLPLLLVAGLALRWRRRRVPPVAP